MKEEKNIVKKYLDEAFYYLSTNERMNMLNKLYSFGENTTFYVQFFENHITKIGIKYNIGKIKCKFYYSTKYDYEILDL